MNASGIREADKAFADATLHRHRVVVWMTVMTFVGPKMTPYSRRQWALLMTTLVVLWILMGTYFLSVVVPAVLASREVDARQLARAGLLNLAIGVPLFIYFGRKILRIR